MTDDMPLLAHLAVLAEPAKPRPTTDLPVTVDSDGPMPATSATLTYEGDTAAAGDEWSPHPPASRIRGRREPKSEWERLLMVDSDQPMPAHLQALAAPRRPAAAIEVRLTRDGQDGEEGMLTPPRLGPVENQLGGNVPWEELLMALQQPMPAHLRALAETASPAPTIDTRLIYEGAAAEVAEDRALISPSTRAVGGAGSGAGGWRGYPLEWERLLMGEGELPEPAHLRVLAETYRPAPTVTATLTCEGEIAPADASSPTLPAAHGERWPERIGLLGRRGGGEGGAARCRLAGEADEA